MTNFPSYRWVLICLYMMSNVSAQMVINTLGILLPSIAEGLDLSPSQQGLLGSSPFWSTIVLAIPIAWAGSRLSPKWLTAVTLVGCALCLFMQGWAPVFGFLLLGRLLFGIFTIAQQPARAMLTRQWFPAREVVLVNGLSNVFFGLVVGGGTGPFAGNPDPPWRRLAGNPAYFCLLLCGIGSSLDAGGPGQGHG